MMDFKDYYSILGVSKTASQEEVRRAFRKLAKKYHPDVAKDKKTAEAKFKEINEAYEVVGDEEKRKKYDQLGSSWNQPEAGAGYGQPHAGRSQRGPVGGMEYHFEGTGFSDFFEQFFGGGGSRSYPQGGGRPRQPRSVSADGEDREAEILVTLEEALRGSQRSISLRKSNPENGQNETQTLKVRIPLGVKEGQKIRLTGQGDPGIGQGQPGDLYLKIRFSQHPLYRVKEQDLFYDLELAPWEAVLGAKIKFHTLDGDEVSVSVPAGVQAGTQLRLRGKGLPDSSGKFQDLFLKISVEIPEKISDAEKKLWEDLREKTTFTPRYE